MKVPCTECKQLCRRKVVNRGVENFNRIYYKCENCKHKVGWEDELMKGTAPWTKEQAAAALQPPQPDALPLQQPAALPPQQPAVPPPKLHPIVPPQQQPNGRRSTNGDEQDVEIVFERPAPQAPNQVPARGPASAEQSAATAPPEQNPGKCPNPKQQRSQQRDSLKPSQTGACAPTTTLTRAQTRHAAAAFLREQQPAAPPPTARPVAASPRRPNHHQGGAQQAQTGSESVPAAASKRKYEEAFVDSAGRPGKRPVHATATVSDAGAGPGPGASSAMAERAAGASNSPPKREEGVFTARVVPSAAGAPGANGVHGATAAPVAGATATPARGNAADGVCQAREGIAVAPARQTTGAQAAPFPSARPATATPTAAAPAASGAPVAGSGSFNPRLTLEQEEMRRLNREVAVMKQSLREEQKRTQQAAAAAEALRLRAEPLERELRELRHLYQDVLKRERQLIEQLNVYKARERMHQQAAQVRAAEVAAARAQAQQQQAQQAAAAAGQEAARQRAQAQAHAQAHVQAEYAKQYGYWGYQQQFNGTGVPQQEYEGAWYGAGGPGAGANGNNAGHPGRGAAGQGSGGGGEAQGPNGGGPAAGGSGGGAAAPPPPPPAEPVAPRDDPAVLAFATAPPPALDENTSVRVLKQFLCEAGAEGSARLCSEKAELLGLARDRLNAWEVRRAVACSRLVAQAQGDRALFRIEPGGTQRAALVKAYRDLTLRLHPDKNPGNDMATQAFQYLLDAYKRLSGPS